MELFIFLVKYFSLFSPLVFIIILIAGRKSSLNKVDKTLIAIVFVSFFTDLFAYYIVDRNYVYLFIYMIVEILLIIYFYKIILIKSSLVISIFTLLFFSTLVLEFFFKNPIYDFFTFTLTIKSLISILLSLLYFYQVYTKEEDIFKKAAPQFWYNVGILIYASLAFFPFFLATEIMSGLFDYNLWYVHNIGNILKNLIFAAGLWMVQKR